MSLPATLQEILSCPKCNSGNISFDSELVCKSCNTTFPLLKDKPFLLNPETKLYDEFHELLTNAKPVTRKAGFKRLFPTPPQRVWTSVSLRKVKQLLEEFNPDDPLRKVMNIGSGTDGVYKKIYGKYQSLVRVGLPLDGKIDVFGDAMNFPLKDESIDLVLSSSVMEHIENVEECVREQFRVLKPGGKVYAEIPFMRAYHMEPIDYQRYTIQGIEKLFERHGFKMVEKGVCSGPFNAMALLWQDFLISMAPGPTKFPVRILSSWLVHPFKYLDRLFEHSKWTHKVACNFYYIGLKQV